MDFKSDVYDRTYRLYLDQVAGLNFEKIAFPLGAELKDGQLVVPMFGRPYGISGDGVFDPDGRRPGHAVSVALCKYLIMCPAHEPRGSEWVSYRDFRDATPFAGAFENHTERAVAKAFNGRLDRLKAASGCLGGRPPAEELAYDHVRVFDAFPRVPVLLLFNDGDDLFPPHCSILFERRAEKYLDMECLAIVGWLLADYLIRQVGEAGAALM